MLTIPTPRIIVHVVPNSNCREYHVNTSISNCFEESFYFPIEEDSKKDLGKVGEVGAELIQKLSSASGTTKASLQQYSVQVTKGEAFDWEDVEYDILLALKECFGDRQDGVEVIVRDTRDRYHNSLSSMEELLLPRAPMPNFYSGGIEDDHDKE